MMYAGSKLSLVQAGEFTKVHTYVCLHVCILLSNVVFVCAGHYIHGTKLESTVVTL